MLATRMNVAKEEIVETISAEFGEDLGEILTGDEEYEEEDEEDEEDEGDEGADKGTSDHPFAPGQAWAAIAEADSQTEAAQARTLAAIARKATAVAQASQTAQNRPAGWENGFKGGEDRRSAVMEASEELEAVIHRRQGRNAEIRERIAAMSNEAFSRSPQAPPPRSLLPSPECTCVYKCDRQSRI